MAKHDSGLRIRIWTMWIHYIGNRCFWCGDPMVAPTKVDDKLWLGATVEHIVPRSLGGSGLRQNLALAHRYCNNVRDLDLTIIPFITDKEMAAYRLEAYRRQSCHAKGWLHNYIQPVNPEDLFDYPVDSTYRIC